jgi:lipopolysaccharide transport system ATP-binding protein
MHMRLAFAVAAHLEPEILIVDEVLAVGDGEFQKKCLGKMSEVAGEGRTVLFVSHNLGAVAHLCKRAILLVEGRVAADGPTSDVLREYVRRGTDTLCETTWDPVSAPQSIRARLLAVRLRSGASTTRDVAIDEPAQVEIEYETLESGHILSPFIHLISGVGVEVLASVNMHSANLLRDEFFGRPLPRGRFRATCTIPSGLLNSGPYSITAGLLLGTSAIEIECREALRFTAHDTGAMRAEFGGHWIGVIRPKLAWSSEFVGDEPGAAKLAGNRADGAVTVLEGTR